MQAHDLTEIVRDAFGRQGQAVSLDIAEHHQRGCDHRGTRIRSVQKAQIVKIKQAILSETDAFLKAEACVLDDTPAIELVAVGIDQQLSCADVVVGEIGNAVIDPIPNGPEFAVSCQVNTLDAEDIQTCLFFQQRPAFFQKITRLAVITV